MDDRPPLADMCKLWKLVPVLLTSVLVMMLEPEAEALLGQDLQVTVNAIGGGAVVVAPGSQAWRGIQGSFECPPDCTVRFPVGGG
jgi:hypothetical protein